MNQTLDFGVIDEAVKIEEACNKKKEMLAISLCSSTRYLSGKFSR